MIRLAVLWDENVPQEAPLQPDPVALQLTLPPSPEVALSDKCSVTVSPARFGTMVTPDAALIVMESDPVWAVREGALESVTRKLRPVTFCAVVGVPEITPEVESERPAGNVPPLRDHL